MEAAGLLKFLYEREFGTHVREAERTKEREQEATANALAANYKRGLRKIPLAPDYVPPSVEPEN